MNILIPALDEERTIGKVIAAIPRKQIQALGYEPRVLVVDGNSQDATRRIAAARGAEIIVQAGYGKGRALAQVHAVLGKELAETPRTAATRNHFVVLDADGTYPPERIAHLVAMLDSGYDFVLGSRFRGQLEDGAMTELNRFGNFLLTRLFRLLTRVRVTDSCTGMYAFNEDVFRRLSFEAPGFDVEADIFVSATMMGARIAEFPVRYGRRVTSPKLIPMRSGVRIAWRMFLRRLRRDEDHAPISIRPHPPVHPFVAWAYALARDRGSRSAPSIRVTSNHTVSRNPVSQLVVARNPEQKQ